MIVEIPVSAGALADALANMRTWLDHNHCEPVLFRTRKSQDADTVLIRVEFKEDTGAEAFQLAFNGNGTELSNAAA